MSNTITCHVKSMKFQYDDGGRAAAGFKGVTGDCVVRAVAIAANMPYERAYNILSYGCKHERKSKSASARNGVHTKRKWFKNFMRSIGAKWIPTMSIGSGCKVHLRDGELPYGRLIVCCSRHLTAVIGDVIHDTYDPSRNGTRCVYGYWKL